MPQPLRFPVVSPHVAAHSILSACSDLKAAIDGAKTHDEFMTIWAIVRDCWNSIEAVSRYARVAADKDR